MARHKYTNELPVIIRYEGEGSPNKPDWRIGELIAVFPTLPGDNSPRSMGCWSAMDGHSTCAAGYIGAKTKPATPEQVQAMLRSLKSQGYDNLRVVSRASSHHAKARRRD